MFIATHGLRGGGGDPLVSRVAAAVDGDFGLLPTTLCILCGSGWGSCVGPVGGLPRCDLPLVCGVGGEDAMVKGEREPKLKLPTEGAPRCGRG